MCSLNTAWKSLKEDFSGYINAHAEAVLIYV